MTAAEQVFDRHGFAATGMARLIGEAGLSSRTVYKHAGSKTALMAAVLRQRHQRFFAAVAGRSVDDLFASMETWVREEGARGCLFFRAQAETGRALPEIEAVVADYHAQLVALIDERVAAELGRPDTELAEQVLVLFEGATTAASYRGAGAITAARAGAGQLIAARCS